GLITANAGAKLNGTASPLQLNGSAGTAGQFLTSAGTGNTPTWTTGSLLPNGSATDNTLRWNGTSWVESANVKSSSAGLVTANAGANLNGATSPLQLNGSAGTTGQIITSTGANSTPAWTTLAAGNNITLTSGAGTLTIASTGGLTNGTATDNTLRWDGSSWVESANIKSSAAGLITANAGANLNGTTSPLQLNGSAGTTGQFLTSAGAGSTPMWTTGNLLPTGSSTDNTLRWNGTSWVENSNVKSSDAGLITANAGANLSGTASPLQLNGVAGNVGQFLTSTGAGSTPTWTSGSLMPSGSSTDNTLRWNGTSWVESANVKSSAAGLVTANAGVSLSGTTSPLQLNGSSGTAGQVLTSAGAGATPTWQTANILTNGTANDNTLRWNGASWVESANIKSSAAGLLTTNAGLNLNGAASPMLLSGSAGTSGQLLMSSGPGATPTWTNAAVLPTGTSTDNTLRWSGTAWVENANIKSSAAGLLTTNAGITISNNTSPLKVRGSDGTTNYVLASQGAGNTPQWTDPNTLVTNAWKLGGNSGTSPGMGANQNYIGTSDAKDLYFGTNGLEHIRISSTAASTATSPLGVIHTKSVLPGGGSGLITGMTVETLFPSTATNPVVAVGGLFSYSTVNNSFALGVFCAANSTVYVTGTASTSTVRALDGIYIAQNSTNGITHSSAIGAYGSIQTASSSNNTTITNGAAFRSDFQLYSSNSTITNAHGLYVENPLLGFGIQNSSITNFNGVYIENLTVGTTKRAFFYDGSSGNAPVAITSLGQLGIGRSDPTQSLEIRNGNILLSNNNNTAGELRLAEPSSSGSYYSSFKSGAQTANINYTLPTALPAANNGLLISSTAGVLNWGSNLAWDNTNARLGANTTSPNTTADINGDLAMRENGFTASNANNNDISIGNFSFVRMTGPNAAFTITGIAGGNNGKMVILYNSTNQNMTISHNDNNSVASNRIYCKGGANVTVGQYGVATLIYNSSDSRWIVVSTN
ncbi:MAG: hypothetical protein Q8916_05480, partial [Bacteroidota bacterium]|nr:hypothetical protein [Bacteroidota bacterium]